MSINVEINKKLITVITVISSLVLTLLGFIANDYLDAFKTTQSEVGELKAQYIRMEEKTNDDKAQWQILQEQSKTIKEQDVKIQVLRMRVDEMSKNKSQEITVNIKGLGFGEDVSPSAILDPIEELPSLPAPPPPEQLEDIEKKIEDLSKEGGYEDYRRDQMMQRQSH